MLACLFAVTAACGTAQAQIGTSPAAKPQEQTGPSLEATQGWLIEKTNARFTNYSSARLTFSGCAMTQVTTVNTGGGPIIYTGVVKHLAELDANNIDVRDWDPEVPAKDWSTVTLQTLGERAIIPLKQDPKPGGGIYTREYSWLKLFYPDRDVAERVKNALQHAIRLCVKQRADQKAAEPPKPKELF